MNALSPAFPSMTMVALSPGRRDLHFRHVLHPIADDLDRMADVLASPTARDWQPDADCIAAGNEHLALAIRCFAAAGLTDQQMRRRLVRTADELADEPHPDVAPDSAAMAVAAHCDSVGMPQRWTAMLLARLSAEIPGFEPQDPDEIMALIRSTFGRSA